MLKSPDVSFAQQQKMIVKSSPESLIKYYKEMAKNAKDPKAKAYAQDSIKKIKGHQPNF